MVGLYVSFKVASTCWCIRHGKRKTNPFKIMVDTVDSIALHMHYRTITSHAPLEITDLSQLACECLWYVMTGCWYTYPSEKWWSEFVSWDYDTPNWMEKTLPKHQPDGYPLTQDHDLSDPENSEANLETPLVQHGAPTPISWWFKSSMIIPFTSTAGEHKFCATKVP